MVSLQKLWYGFLNRYGIVIGLGVEGAVIWNKISMTAQEWNAKLATITRPSELAQFVRDANADYMAVVRKGTSDTVDGVQYFGDDSSWEGKYVFLLYSSGQTGKVLFSNALRCLVVENR